MVTLKRESSQFSQSLPICLISLFTENNAVQEIRFYKTWKILFEKELQATMPLLGAKERRIILEVKKRKIILGLMRI